MRYLIQERTHGEIAEPVFDRQTFEESGALRERLDKHIDAAKVEEKLGAGLVREIVGHQISLKATGSSLETMVESLLPPTLSAKTKKSLAYALSIVAVRPTEFSSEWPIHYAGLDRLGSAILHIYRIVGSLGYRVPWLRQVWQSEVSATKVACLREILAVLRSGTTCGEVRLRLKRAIDEIAKVAPMDILSRDTIQPWLNRLPETQSEADVDLVLTNAETGRSVVPKMRQQLREVLSGLQQRETLWSSTSVSSDGAITFGYDDLMALIHDSMNILRNSTVVKLCDIASRINRPMPVSTSYIMKEVGVGKRHAQALEQVMTESYFPAIANLGLRFRYILAPASRAETDTDGLFEKMSVTSHAYRHGVVQGFVEPEGSNGPRSEQPDGALDFVLDADSVSLRSGLFSTVSADWREPWLAPVDSAVSPPVLFAATRLRKPMRLSTRQTEALGLLWGMSGTYKRREALLESRVMPRRTRSHVMQQMFQKKAFFIVHHPRLEYVGLPDGVLVAAKGLDEQSMKESTDWFREISPYLEIYSGKTTGDAVWIIRVPKGRQPVVAGRAEEKLSDKGVECVTCRIRRQVTYRLSALSRIHDSRTDSWIDPWNRESG